jgi:hypothetical protein
MCLVKDFEVPLRAMNISNHSVDSSIQIVYMLTHKVLGTVKPEPKASLIPSSANDNDSLALPKYIQSAHRAPPLYAEPV